MPRRVLSTSEHLPSWLTYLDSAGLLRLLRIEFQDGKRIGTLIISKVAPTFAIAFIWELPS